MEAEPREFELTEADFRRIRGLVKDRSGIDLGENKRALVYGRLARRIRALGLSSFASYLSVIEDPQADEAGRFINAITTNVTEFFRENHHFEFLARTVLPETFRQRPCGPRLRIWSAGCSTGEEPYSIAMTIAEATPPPGAWDMKVLATDLDSEVLARAEAGIYPADRLGKTASSQRERWFEALDSGDMEVRDSIRRLITFKQLNLMEPWPMKGPFDVIFCRNVIIYFDDATKRRLIERYRSLLRDGGYLFLGHSESLGQGIGGLSPCGRTIYRKTGVGERA